MRIISDKRAHLSMHKFKGMLQLRGGSAPYLVIRKDSRRGWSATSATSSAKRLCTAFALIVGSVYPTINATLEKSYSRIEAVTQSVPVLMDN